MKKEYTTLFLKDCIKSKFYASYNSMQNDIGKEQEMKADLCTTDTETRQTRLNQCTQSYIGLK